MWTSLLWRTGATVTRSPPLHTRTAPTRLGRAFEDKDDQRQVMARRHCFRIGLNEITFSRSDFSLAVYTFPQIFSFDRRTWDKGYDKGDCKVLQFYNSVLVFVKYDVLDDTSPKFVGTYSVTRDRLYYFGYKGGRVMVTNFRQRIAAGIMSPTKYEVVCARERTW
ncbi:30S ribosomal protein S10 domain protein [Ostertagia ostertagi]